MKTHREKTGEILNGLFQQLADPAPLPEEAESAGRRVLVRLELESSRAAGQVFAGPVARRPIWRMTAIAATALVVLIATVVVWSWAPADDSMRMESALTTWRPIVVGDVVNARSFADYLVLPDGSRVEMRAQSQLALEAATDGLRIRLNRGSVIVSAAEQIGGHLYVETKDVKVSVVGTVFLVNTEEQGSRVAVIQGAVRVQHGTEAQRILPGKQVATAPVMAAATIAEELSWSRNVAEHLALLEQESAAVSRPLGFEADSVRPNKSGSTSSRMEDENERVMITNATLKQIIQFAINDSDTSISGPRLLESGRYDIQAKAPSGTPKSNLRLMLQELLVRRFKMSLRRETKEMDVFNLITINGALKVKEMPQGQFSSGGGAGGLGDPGLSTTQTIGDMKSLAAKLSGILGRPVLDKTGLTGRYEIKLVYLRDRGIPAEGVFGPSIYEALQEQVGLKLVPGRGPVETIVIDHIEEPDSN